MDKEILLNQEIAFKFNLSIQQAFVYSWIVQQSSLLHPKTLHGEKLYYDTGIKKALEALPILTDKPDTMYRIFKALKDIGLIDYMKFESKYVVLINDIDNVPVNTRKYSRKSNTSLKSKTS